MTRITSLRGCDLRSHALPTRFLIVLSLALLQGCALMRTPAPLTTLQLPLDSSAASPQWPAALAPGSVQGTAALQGNRVLVVQGALLMQHEGLRWVDAPPVLLAEQLRGLHARAASSNEPVATLDLWLSAFNLRVATDGTRDVMVSASATVRCNGAAGVTTLAPSSASSAPAGKDAQSLADAFATASGEVLAAIFNAAVEPASICATAATSAPAPTAVD